MLDKAIEHGKEFRKPYYKKAPSSDKICRCHGSCPRCYDNRMYKIQKKPDSMNSALLDYKKYIE